MNEGQSPNFRGVRAHVSTGYNHVEGNRRERLRGVPRSRAVLRRPNPNRPIRNSQPIHQAVLARCEAAEAASDDAGEGGDGEISGDAKRFLGDAKSSLGDAKSSLGDV